MSDIIIEAVTPQAVMATIVIKMPDGQTKTFKQDLGHTYDYRLDDAQKDLEKMLISKGIKNFTIHLDRYDDGGSKPTSNNNDYIEKTPSVGKPSNTDFMDKSPATGKPSTTSYLDKGASRIVNKKDDF